MMKVKSAVLFIWLVLLLSGCSAMDAARTKPEPYKIYSVNIYQNTPAWELAKAVRAQNTKKIASIAKAKPELLNYQDPLYETTLLVWAVGTERYDAAEALLKAGADPNIISKYVGGTALYEAAYFSWVDNDAKEDPKYVKLLLKHHADPNIGFVGNDHDNSTEIGETPLIHSIGCGIEKTKALVEGGADINYRTKTGMTAAVSALWAGGGGVLESEEIYAHYLIADKHADITKPWIRKPMSGPSTEVAPVTFLRDWTPKLDSNGYRMKMEIVKEFKRQGIDYWSTEIPDDVVEHMKKLYPDTWQEYLKKY